MINVIVEPEFFLGLIFASLMLLFYCLRFFHPAISTDWDVFIATIGIVYSAILMIHGWRLDPILLFSQILVIFISLSFCWVLIRQREIIRRLLSE